MFPRGATVNATNNWTALLRFVKVLMKKRQEMAAGGWYATGPMLFPHRPTVQDCLAAINIKTIMESPYMLVMAPAVCFLFERVKAELAVIAVMRKSLQMTWDGV
jgi:hypothetical protein